MSVLTKKPLRHWLTLLAGVIGIILLGVMLERHSALRPLRARLQQQTVPSGLLAYSDMGSILRQLDMIRTQPNVDLTDSVGSRKTLQSTLSAFQPKNRSGIQVYGFDAAAPEALPSSRQIPPFLLTDPAPLLSMSIAPADLYDADIGLLTHPEARGKNWERTAYLSYVTDGRVRFATGVGLRIHGGVARTALKKSFRVYFKDIYGERQFAPGLLFDKASDPVRRLALRSGFETGGLFVNSLAYDIARQLGALAPQTQTVRFVLNGEYQGVYILIEHISDGYLQAHFGHDDFILAQSQSPDPPDRGRQRYDDFLRWAFARTPLTFEDAARVINLENFCRWLIATIFCATPDALQGQVLLNLRDPAARWFWINWDMDHSLVVTNYNHADNAWEEDIFDRFYLTDPRSMLYHRLRLGSPKFRQYFTRLFVDLLNHRLTDQFLQARLAYYASEAKIFQVNQEEFDQFYDEAAQFFTHRKAILRSQMSTYFAAGASVRCQVLAPANVRFEIDGYPEQNNYTGWYFSETPITIKITDAAGLVFSHWLINGQERRSEPVLQYHAAADATIQAIFLPRTIEASIE